MRIQTFILICLLLTVPCRANTIIVDPNGSGDFTSIQDAIDNAEDLDTIQVRPGTYYEKINFYSKAITVTSTDPNNIDVVYATVIDGGSSGNVVTFNNGEDNTSVLDGLTVQNGNPYGIYCWYSSPLVRKCVVRNSYYGIVGQSASPTILECIVEGNTTIGISGCNGEISNCRIVNNKTDGLYLCGGNISGCTIEYNSGNGLNKCGGNISDCTIKYNSGNGLSDCGNIIGCDVIENNGYGIVFFGQSHSSSYSQILNCVIAGNRSHGVLAGEGGSPNYIVEIRNCTILGNKGSGVVLDRHYPYYYSVSAVIANSIIVKNQNYGIYNWYNIGCTLKYNNVWSNFQGNYYNVTGETDIHVNPLFSSIGYWDANDNWVDGDYHLRSTAGRWNGTSWVYDSVNSPCIDAGDPNDNVGYEPNPNGARINMGAYGGTAEASKSPSGIVQPVCTEYPSMDFNKDCKVDFQDFALFAQGWLDCNLDPPSACWE